MLHFDDRRIFRTSRNIPELEEIITELKTLMYNKYYIDYLGIHVIDRESRYMISRLDHPQWHEYYWQDNKLQICPAIQQLRVLEKYQQIIMFFQTYQSSALYEARGDIIGKVTAGFSILMGDMKTGNRIQFCITFKDGISIDRLNADVLMNLIKDLNKVKNIFNPFMEYFTKIGNLNYTQDLKKFVNNKKILLKLD